MIRIRAMSAADLPLGMRLKSQAGWNQTLADWQRVLDLEPAGCFVAECEGEAVGTAAAVVFGSVAWIMMVLVDEAFRGRGIGTRLMQHALDYLRARAVPTVRLDATPLGRPVYEKLGFQAEYELARYEHAGLRRNAAAAGNVDPHQLGAICALDRQATGTDRSRLLARLYAERPAAFAAVFHGKTPLGYRSLRAGARATQIGPVVAATAETGRMLLDGAVTECGPVPIFIDIPLENRPAVQWAESNGLTLQRHLTRMWQGRRIEDRPAQLWASFGPEKG